MTAIKANDFNGQEKEWCPGADLNHRHEDFQYKGEAESSAVRLRKRRLFSIAHSQVLHIRTYAEM